MQRFNKNEQVLNQKIIILPKSEPHGVCIDEHGRYAYGNTRQDSVIKISN